MYTLYKNPVEESTREIVRHLMSLKIYAKPTFIIERNHGPEVTELPAIKDMESGEMYIGLDRCLQFYEETYGVTGLRDVICRRCPRL